RWSTGRPSCHCCGRHSRLRTFVYMQMRMGMIRICDRMPGQGGPPMPVRSAVALLLFVSAAVPLSVTALADTSDSPDPESAENSEVSLPNVRVVGSRLRAESVSVSKSDVPLLETPQNIQVLSADLLQDQGAKALEDALRNVAGVM